MPRIAALGLLLLAASALAVTVHNPHAFMDDPGRCRECHLEEPVAAGGALTMDIVSLCVRCHAEREENTHPVDIHVPAAEAVLPVDRDGDLTCVTCHDPHADPYAPVPYVEEGLLGRIRGIVSERGFKTFFLREPNDRGQICRYCHEPATEAMSREIVVHSASVGDYRGSESCSPCHGREHAAWKLTLHARTLLDPERDPGAVKAVFTGEEPFGAGDIVRTIGNHWTQRYLVDRDGELRVARGVWSLAEGRWAQMYWREQPWREKCAGCHYTAYDPYTESYVEEGVGCEACHGPGGRHVDSRRAADILNPGRMARDDRDLICASCHTHGHDRTGEFRYPVGYVPGAPLDRYYTGLIPKKGQDEGSFRDDGTLADRLRSLRFWVDRYLSPTGVNCTLCKSYRAGSMDREAPSAAPDDRMSLAEHCLGCHRDFGSGDRRHPPGGEPVFTCYPCHEPLRARDGSPSVHDHKFVFRTSGSGL